jgi:protein-S-isoprenylcysteine O-methyltransferase Ste14
MQNQIRKKPRFGGRGEYLVAIQVIIVAAFLMVPPWPPEIAGETLPWLGWLRLAALLLSGGVALFFAVGGFLAIRKYLTPLPYPVEDNRLVETGVYGVIRHPLYSSQLFAAAGWTLFTASLPHLLITLAAFAFFNFKASKEEAWLTERHPEYPDYARRVGKLFPRFRKK